jgi:hypothetical protein
MLPHYKNSQSAVSHIEPIYINLYEISYIFRTPLQFSVDELFYIDDNTTGYDLRKNRIILNLNMLEHCSITNICKIFNDIEAMIIEVHNKKGEIKRKMELQFDKNCLEDFSFKQDLNNYNGISYLEITLKYREITSEIIA